MSESPTHTENGGVPIGAPGSTEIEEVTPDLPVDIQADFAHPSLQQQGLNRTFKQTVDPSHFDSFQAQAAFDLAVQAADRRK